MRWLDDIINSTDRSEQVLGVGDGQGSLACCTPWGHKEPDMTEGLNWTIQNSTQHVNWHEKISKICGKKQNLQNSIFFSLWPVCLVGKVLGGYTGHCKQSLPPMEKMGLRTEKERWPHSCLLCNVLSFYKEKKFGPYLLHNYNLTKIRGS